MNSLPAPTRSDVLFIGHICPVSFALAAGYVEWNWRHGHIAGTSLAAVTLFIGPLLVALLTAIHRAGLMVLGCVFLFVLGLVCLMTNGSAEPLFMWLHQVTGIAIVILLPSLRGTPEAYRFLFEPMMKRQQAPEEREAA